MRSVVTRYKRVRHIRPATIIARTAADYIAANHFFAAVLADLTRLTGRHRSNCQSEKKLTGWRVRILLSLSLFSIRSCETLLLQHIVFFFFSFAFLYITFKKNLSSSSVPDRGIDQQDNLNLSTCLLYLPRILTLIFENCSCNNIIIKTLVVEKNIVARYHTRTG